MDLKELSRLDVKDLKNLDFQAILTQLKKRPDIIITTIMILVTVIFCSLLYSNKKTKFAAQRQELTALEEKDTAFTQLQDIQLALKTLKSVLPEAITEAKLIEIITQASSAYNINISSFSPASMTTQAAYSSITLSINITAPSYADLWKFIYKLESENKSLRIDSWSTQQDGGGYRQRGLSSQTSSLKDSETIGSAIALTLINFKHD
jgi:Tfp pilus assembly protein PilO